MSFEDTVDEVLDELIGAINSNEGSNYLTDEDILSFRKAKAALLAAHEAEVELVIGEDEDFKQSRVIYEVPEESHKIVLPNMPAISRNELRYEQRQRAGITYTIRDTGDGGITITDAEDYYADGNGV